MPITQDRLLDLLTEYESFARAHDRLMHNLNRVAECGMTATDKAELFRAEVAACEHIPRTFMMIERRHYNANHRRNDRTREREARKRRERGVPERDSDQYRMNATRYAHDALADKSYYDAMQGQPITDEEIAALLRNKVAQAPAPDQVVITDEFGNTMTQAQIDAMNARGVIDEI
jgi:hypothetical protein